MRPLIKLIAILIVIILVASSVYAVVSLGGNGGDKNNPGNVDDIPPTIDSITGDTEGSTGKITSIAVSFSDNEEVTEATIFFKSMNNEAWKAESILSGSYDISIPSESDDDWYYFVTVDDAAGNGPIGEPSTDGSTYFTITVTETVEELVHTVFIEEATGENCPNCPPIAELLHELYHSGDYNFEYISLINEHENGNKRMKDHYNQFALPTTYIDAGYKVITGGAKSRESLDDSKYIEALRSAEQRSVPEIKVTVDVEYENNSDKFTTNVVVKSFETEAYTGSLKVYLAEIVSRYKIEGKTQIYHGFLDFIIDEPEISVDAGEKYSISQDRDLSGLDPENLMIVAVVFSSKSEQRYSFENNPVPGGGKYPFDAYFSDATAKTTLIEGGNLPPKVGITNPKKGFIHIFGSPIFQAPLSFIGIKTTRLIGKTTISIDASDEDGAIDKVELYIDGELIETFEEEPYEYEIKKIGLFKSIFFKKHVIKVIAYDDTGKTSEAELTVKARW